MSRRDGDRAAALKTIQRPGVLHWQERPRAHQLRAGSQRWFPETGREHEFGYESTTDWRRLNTEALKAYQVVVFLDTRPDDPAEREAFKRYMEHGGAWLGFHFSGFALTPSDTRRTGTGTTTNFWSGAGREQHVASDVGGASC